MATVKISELPAMTNIASSDILPIVDVSETETKKVTKEMLLSDIDASQLDLSNMTEATQINDTDYLIINQNGETKKISKSNSQFASGDEVAISTTTPSDPEDELKIWINPYEVVTPSKIFVTDEYSDDTNKSYSCDYINGLQLGGGGSYSTDETNTGSKWIDNKPIYRRVINENSSVTGLQTVQINDLLIDQITDARIIYNMNNTGTMQSIGSIPVSMQRSTNSSVLQFTFGSNTAYGYRLVIEYTKN